MSHSGASSRDLRGWLLLSLAANGLLAMLALGGGSKPTPGPLIPERPLRTGAATFPIRSDPRTGRGSADRQPFTNPWQALTAGDYTGTIALLRASHCPEETIQDLIALRMSRDYEQRLQARLSQRRAGHEWWKADAYREATADQRDQRALKAERDLQFQELLGVPFTSSVGEFFPWKQDVDPDPVEPGHRRPYAELLARHSEEEAAVRERGDLGSVLDSAQEAERAALKQRQRAEIEALLNPAELLELELRNGPVARFVKEHLPEAQSAGEFREMLRIAKELGYDTPAKLAAPPGESPEEGSLRIEELRRQLRERLRQSLGADRVDELERADAALRQRVANREAEREEQETREQMRQQSAGMGIEPAALDQFMERFKARAQEIVGENTGVWNDSDEGRQLLSPVASNAATQGRNSKFKYRH